MNRNMCGSTLVILFLLSSILCPAYARAGFQITQLTETPHRPTAVEIADNGYVVWTEVAPEGDARTLWLYDGREFTPLSQDPDRAHLPRVNAFGAAVWSEEIDGNFEVFRHQEGVTTQLTRGGGNCRAPDINRLGHIVWEEHGEEDTRIMYYDGIETTQISDPACPVNLFPRISDMDYVVWTGHDGTGFDIYLYPGALPIHRVTDDAADDLSPVVGGEGNVYWQHWDGMDWEICLHRADWGGIGLLTNNNVDDQNLSISDNGFYAVWEEPWAEGGGRAIMRGDHVMNVQEISADTADNAYPDVNNRGHVVWEARELGEPTLSISRHDDRGNVLLAGAEYRNNRPRINNEGSIAWIGKDSAQDPADVYLGETICGTLAVRGLSPEDGVVEGALNSILLVMPPLALLTRFRGKIRRVSLAGRRK